MSEEWPPCWMPFGPPAPSAGSNLFPGFTFAPRALLPDRTGRGTSMVTRCSRLPAWLAILAFLFAVVQTPAGAAAKWVRLRSKNFTLIGDAGERTLRAVATRLEEFRETLVRTLPNAAIASPVPTVVLVFASQASFEPFKPLYHGKTIELGGYFVMGEHVNYVALTLEGQGDAVYPIVFHEYTHFMVNNTVAAIPTWLGEGLAEFYGTFETLRNGTSADIGRANAGHVRSLRAEPLLPIQQLIEVDRTSPVYNEGSRRGMFYAESWALVHYLTIGSPARQGQLDSYVAQIRKRVSPADAFREAFKCEPAVLEEELRDYVHRFTFNVVRWTFTESVATRISASADPMSDSEVQGWLGDLLAHAGRADEAKARLQAAIQSDPNAALPLAMLGLLHLRGQELDAALPLLQRAATLTPEDATVQSALGHGLVRRLERQGASARDDHETIERARHALSKAVALAPDNASALGALAYVELVAGTGLADGRSAIERAIALAPSRESYRLVLGQLLLQQRDFTAARQVLGPLMGHAADEGVRTRARAIMGAMSVFERELRERADAESAARQPGRQPEAPAPPTSPASTPEPAETRKGPPEFIPDLRQPRDGEERHHGQLESIECLGDGVIALHVRIDGRLRRFGAKGLGAVEFISYRNDVRGEVTCGPVRPPQDVLLTRRPSTGVAAGQYPFEGEAVAVEFLPDGYVPPPVHG